MNILLCPIAPFNPISSFNDNFLDVTRLVMNNLIQDVSLIFITQLTQQTTKYFHLLGCILPNARVAVENTLKNTPQNSKWLASRTVSSLYSVIIMVRIGLWRTVFNNSDRHFDNHSRWCHQSQVRRFCHLSV